MKVEDMMTPEQRKLIDQPKAWDNLNRVMGHQLGATCFQMTGHFHQVMKIETPDAPIMPSVSMRERRLRLILEEFLELVEAMGFRLVPGICVGDSCTLQVEHIEGSRYDLVETADALGDLNVVVNGTGVEFGIPMHFIDYEIYSSNLSKLDENGEPIVNGVTPGYRGGEGFDFDESGYQANCPVGKILKPESYVPANIPAVLVAYQNKEI